jgi:gluconate 5-dehydrogenase
MLKPKIPQSFPEAFSLRGQTVVITGGGTGIGKAIAGRMHAAGAQTVLIGLLESELAATAREMGERVGYIEHDITRLNETPALVERITRQWGPISCLVNNAGIHLKKAAIDTTPEEFQSVLTTHVLAAHALTRAIAPGMIERRSGSILFTCSMSAYMGIPLVVAYSAAKSAHVGMVRTLAAEFSPHGVRVNAIAPGWIETAMARRALAGDPAREQKIISRTPMARFGEPDDIGWAAVYLTSPAAKFVTGVVLPVDGGASIGF